jgi:hypothetical protein
MTIDEAIKELQKDIIDWGGPGTSPICQAERLGIEALKRHRDYPLHTLDGKYQPLPGETEE